MKKQLPYFLIVFLVPVIAVLWWWGLFSSAKVEIAERGGYRYAYLDAQGVYSKLGKKRNEVLFTLDQQHIKAGAEITLMLSDPRTTPHEELKAQTGFIIDADATPQAPLKVATIPQRQVAVAEIRAHPLFAYGKAYSALLEYAKIRDTTLHLPTLEIFHDSKLTVEMPLQAETGPGVTP
ncbi:MAG TPA: GyrI-like domain-containing protein [Methylophilaceae bacterium]|nr:GyrI-like domain-containing protein [Methylophilaceae bacterium]